MQSAQNPFVKKVSRRNKIELFQKVSLFSCTYSIVAMTMLLFIVIIVRGGPVLYNLGLDFITRKPETLEVISFDAAKDLQMPAKSFDTMLKYNHAIDKERDPTEGATIVDAEPFQKGYPYTSFKIQPDSYIGDSYLSLIEKENEDFRPRYLSRSKTKDVGFTLKEDTQLRFTTDLYAKVIKANEDLAALEAKDVETEIKTFKLTFDEAYCTIPAKTMKVLETTNLVYYLYQNLREKADDEPEFPMPLDIPLIDGKPQQIILSEKQHTAFTAAPGKAPVSNTEELVEKVAHKQIEVSKGTYIIPFNLFVEVYQQNQGRKYQVEEKDGGNTEMDEKSVAMAHLHDQ